MEASGMQVRGRSMVALVEAASGRERDPDLADLDDGALEEQVRIGASELAAATCRWLELVAELTVRGIWARQGFATPATWLAWAVSMGSSTAREHVRVALSLADWPVLHATFRRGELSYSKVRAITRYGDPAAEELLLRYAAHADGAQLERILRGFDQAAPDRDVDRRNAFDRREVTFRELDADSSELRLVGPTDLVVRVLAVLDQHAQAARREDRTAAQRAATDDGVEPVEVEGVAAYRADVLAAAVERTADEVPPDASGGDRHTVVWHVQAGDLQDVEGPPDRSEAGRVPVEVATRSATRSRSMSLKRLARLACGGASVVALHDEDGTIEAISGRTRRVPPRLMRALRARDRRCRYPGCGRSRWVEAHHIREVSNGGQTRLDNLLLLCVRHHHVVHDDGVTILHDGRGHVRFVLADGNRLEPSPQLPGASAEALHPQPSVENSAGSSVLQPTAYEQRIDLEACVEVLLQELDLLEPPGGLAA